MAGNGVPVPDPNREIAELYRVSGVMVLARSARASSSAPPFGGVPPLLSVYRERGHRRLASRTYAS